MVVMQDMSTVDIFTGDVPCQHIHLSFRLHPWDKEPSAGEARPFYNFCPSASINPSRTSTSCTRRSI
jgi:hypothetical protein